MHSNESGSSWPSECTTPSTIKARRPFRLASNPWATELGGPSQGYAHLTVPRVRYVGPDCAAQSYPQAVSSSPPSLQGGFPYPTWSAPPPCALQDTSRRMTSALRGRRSPETTSTFRSLVRPSPSPPTAYNLPKTSPVSYEEAVRIAWAQPCPAGVSDRGESSHSEGYPATRPKSVDEILPAIRSEAKLQEGMRGFPGSAGRSEAEGCGLVVDVSRMANDGQMDLIPLDQRLPRSVGNMAVDCDVSYAASSNGGAVAAAAAAAAAAEDGCFNPESAADLLMMDGYSEGQAVRGEECDDSSGRLSLAGGPHKVSPIPAAAWYRKLCEVSGCNIQPSYGERGTSRPLYCARHKKEGMVGLKNRPCLYPGCSIRPHYGLPGGRAFYCTSHKKDGMVHLLKEITTRAKLERESKLVEAGGVLMKRKRCPYGTGSYARRTRAVEIAAEAGQQGSERGNKGERGGDEAEPESENIGVLGGDGIPGGEEGCFNMGPGIAKGGMSNSPALAVTVAPSSPASLSSRSSSIPLAVDEGLRSPTEMREAGFATPPSTPSAHSESPPPHTTSTSRNTQNRGTQNHGAQNSGTQNSSMTRHRGTSTGPLSWETTITTTDVGVGRTRHNDVVGEGTTWCKRSRAPSRKAMEALGKAEGEGAQWMTKEKREERARLSEKLRRQRKAAAAAGLKAGEVLEEYYHVSATTPSPPVDAETRSREEENDDASCDEGSGRRQGARNEPQGRSGRKVSSTETTHRGTKTQQQHSAKVASRHPTETTHQGKKAQQHSANVGNRHPAGYGAAPSPASKRCPGALSHGRNGSGVEARDPAMGDSIVAHGDDASSSSKQRRPVGKKKRDAAQAEQAGKRANSHGARGGRGWVWGGSRGGAERGKAGAWGRNEPAKQTECEFQTCSKMATFGVNLTLRYCELHRLFGMHEIAGKH